MSREEAVGCIVGSSAGTAALKLTRRQRQVLALYLGELKSQVQIATKLGISQQTVSQHLVGKQRGGKKIGGAASRIRNATQREIRERPGEGRRSALATVLGALLADHATRRRMTRLLRGLK